ncbi:MAG: class I SAM-dependent methyltransferase [bacterium]
MNEKELPDDYNTEILSQREIWDRKEVLRLIYRDWYKDIVARMKAPDTGVNLELGCGCGNFKKYFPNVISSDMFANPWVDMVTSADVLPFAPESIDNIVMIDVLHHLKYPAGFFSEAQKILKPKGRLIMIEPYVYYAAFLLYRFLHHEPVDLGQEPFPENGERVRETDFANEALPSIIFEKHFDRFKQKFPGLKLVMKRFFCFWAYPLSGGFNYFSLIGPRGYRWLNSFERKLENRLGRFLAMRMQLVIEKQ